jgi:hypothetical protein
LHVTDDEEGFRVFHDRFYQRIADELERCEARLSLHRSLTA